MSTITPTTTADACPAWCTHHSSPADDSLKPWHAAAVLVGGLTLGFSEDPDDDEGPVFSPPDSLNGLTLLEARRYALALLQACDRIGGAEPTRVRIAWRVYDRIMEGPVRRTCSRHWRTPSASTGPTSSWRTLSTPDSTTYTSRPRPPTRLGAVPVVTG
jgi:hypothetical protein